MSIIGTITIKWRNSRRLFRLTFVKLMMDQLAPLTVFHQLAGTGPTELYACYTMHAN